LNAVHLAVGGVASERQFTAAALLGPALVFGDEKQSGVWRSYAAGGAVADFQFYLKSTKQAEQGTTVLVGWDLYINFNFKTTVAGVRLSLAIVTKQEYFSAS
jgi:hypothetical protein